MWYFQQTEQAPPPLPSKFTPVPTSGFITVLADAYLVDMGGRSVVASATIMCDVPARVASDALAHPQQPTLLGHWDGTFRGASDRWGIWYCHDVPWAATSDVNTPAHAAHLIDEFTVAMQQADREGRIHSPSPTPTHYSHPIPSRATRSETNTGFLGGFLDGFGSAFGGRGSR